MTVPPTTGQGTLSAPGVIQPTPPPAPPPTPPAAPSPQPVSPYNVPGAVTPAGAGQPIGSANITVGNGQISVSSLAGGTAGGLPGQTAMPQTGGAVPGGNVGNVQSQAITVTANTATVSIANAQQANSQGAPNLDVINQFTTALSNSVNTLNSLGETLKQVPDSIKTSLDFKSLNEQVTAQLAETVRGFGESVKTAGTEFTTSIQGLAGDVKQIDFGDLASSIAKVSEKANEFASQNFNEPIKVDISGNIDTPEIKIDANINVSALQASINNMASSIKQIVNDFKNDLERRLSKAEQDIRSLRQSSK